MNYSPKNFLILILLLILPVGEVNAAPEYDHSELFVFRVKIPESAPLEKTGYLLISTGKWIILPQFDSANGFSNSGRAKVSIITWPSSRDGYIDLQGNMVIKPQYISADHFFEGLARVVEIDVGKGLHKHVYIDTDGGIAIQLPDDPKIVGGNDGNFHEGMADVRDETGRVGFIDRSGNLVVQPRFGKVTPFSEGLAVVQEGEEQRLTNWGAIDKSGNYLIAPQYANMKSFTDGLAACQISENGLWGYINKTGLLVIEPQFAEAGPFHDDLAPVMQNGKWGFINQGGEFLIAPTFDSAQGFYQGVARVGVGESYGWIDREGKWVVHPLFKYKSFYIPKHKIIYEYEYISGEGVKGYFYDMNRSKLDHYANHMTDAYQYMKERNYKAAALSFKAALVINPQDEAASWGLRLAEASQKE